MNEPFFYSQIIVVAKDGRSTVINSPIVHTEKTAFCDGMERAAIEIVDGTVNTVYISGCKCTDTITVMRAVRVA